MSQALHANMAKEATVFTDEAKPFTGIGKPFADNHFTTHSKTHTGPGQADALSTRPGC